MTKCVKVMTTASIMRSVEQIDKEGMPPRKVLIREDVAKARLKGITVIRRDVE